MTDAPTDASTTGAAAEDPRGALRNARRVVLKVGSRAITAAPDRFARVADQVAQLHAASARAVVVSSGAVALGCERLGIRGRPRAVPQLQAAAAVGQSRLIQAYEAAFAEHDLAVGQVLLTHAGMADRLRYLNARHAIDALFEVGAVPIINENDTVSTEEIEFGDNDQLAAMVASLIGADLLVLLTDVDGVLDDGGARVSVVRDVAAAEALVYDDENDRVALGGMGSKIGAARRALQRGLPVVIAPAADPNVLRRILAGDDVGTLFLPQGAAMASRSYWIAYTLKAQGDLHVDPGAASALLKGKRSLLPVGVTAVQGDFQPGDAVRILADGKEIARGLCRYGARDVTKLMGAPTTEIQARLGHHDGDEIVHRDDLVVL